MRTTCSGPGAELGQRLDDDLEAALRLAVRVGRADPTPSGMTGAVPAIETTLPTRTARE